MTDYIEQLKQVKVPLRYQWLGMYRAWKRRRAARKEIHYVATVAHYVHFTPVYGNPHIRQAWYVLKERGDGKRFYDYVLQPQVGAKETKTWVYAHIVLPWTLGHWSNKQIVDWAAQQKVPQINA